jgi:hypothetical protein
LDSPIKDLFRNALPDARFHEERLLDQPGFYYEEPLHKRLPNGGLLESPGFIEKRLLQKRSQIEGLPRECLLPWELPKESPPPGEESFLKLLRERLSGKGYGGLCEEGLPA